MYFVVMAACLVLNAIIACIEMAFVSVSPNELRNLSAKGNKSAAKLLVLRANPERTLSILQVGLTLVGAVSAAVGGAGAEETFGPVLTRWFDLEPSAGANAALAAVVLPITFLTVVLGELVPKTLALRNASRVALCSVHALEIFDRILAPAVSLLEGSTRLILRGLGVRPTDAAHEEDAFDIDQVSEKNRPAVLNMAALERKNVTEVMVPWEKVASLDLEMNPEAALRVVLASGHTRLPVTDRGAVVGFVHTKDFAAARFLHGQSHWHQKVRPIARCNFFDDPLEVLRALQRRRDPMVLVLDFDGNAAGILTVQDILEKVLVDRGEEPVAKLAANHHPSLSGFAASVATVATVATATGVGLAAAAPRILVDVERAMPLDGAPTSPGEALPGERRMAMGL